MKIAMYIASTGSLVDKVIDIGTGLFVYSHCEIVFEKHGPPAEDEKWLTCSASPRDNKVRFNEIDIYSKHWHVVDLPELDDKEDEIYEFCKKYIGSKYDWRGIFFWFIFFWMKEQDNDKWWCSEFCAHVLNSFKADCKSRVRVSPNHLARKLKCPRQPFKFMFTMKKSY